MTSQTYREGWIASLKAIASKPLQRQLFFASDFKVFENRLNDSKNAEMGDLNRIPEPPDGMNEIASGYWKKKCQDLKDMGKLSSNVLESLEAYCNHLADMQKARTMMDNAWGQEVFFRYQKAYIEANKQQIALAREFGFTPMSSKKFPKGKEKKNPAGGLD